MRRVLAALLTAAVFSLFLALAQPASAQVMSKWGHPVVTFGWTPYDSVNTGHGNYPGSPGFIPGYGYYPSSSPDHYPWMDGPGTPFDRRKLNVGLPNGGIGETLATPQGEQPPPPGQALIIVKIPGDAELTFDGAKTSQTGTYRRFLTPTLPNGQAFVYTLQVRWLTKGVELLRTEQVTVAPGTTSTANFLTTDSWTGRRLPTLPAPKVVPKPMPEVSVSAIPD